MLTLRELAELEVWVLAADGGRLKLEWPVLRSRARQDVDALWWEEDRLLGFLGLIPSKHRPSREPAWSIRPPDVAGSLASAGDVFAGPGLIV